MRKKAVSEAWTKEYDQAAKLILAAKNAAQIQAAAMFILHHDLKGNVVGHNGTLLEIARSAEKKNPAISNEDQWGILINLLQ